ncbi:YheC/YheD family protein [Paenibacillus sp. sgz500958]|uniref:YheC/YheD family endospore coat-associated protein n=1 Tax=Paenibacillus sp. sgz500958 TaxID=3242475 RepID=UPI0036D2E25E
MERRFAGILLNSVMYRGIPRLNTGQESLSNYEEAASLYGVTPCYLRLEDIDAETGFAYAFIKGTRGYARTIIPIPGVIHNRAIIGPENKRIEQLIRKGPKVFNTCNRYGKDIIHGLLEQHEDLKGYLPATEKGASGLKTMMQQFPDLILKPCRGSVGNGVMRLTHVGNGRWIWSLMPSQGRWVTVPVHQDALPKNLLLRLAAVPYLVQERISLAEITGRPFDLRVSVQRNWGGEWQLTGMFAKVAPPGGFVSNIARGGEAVNASDALDHVFPRSKAANLRMAAGSLGLSVARALDQHLEGLADIGLDIGITGDGRLFFIECNGRDQRYGFLKAGLAETWKKSYTHPISYARYLMESGVPR